MKLPIVFNNIPPGAEGLVAAASQTPRLVFSMRGQTSAAAPVATAPVRPTTKVRDEDQIVTSPDGEWALSLSRFMAMWQKA
jgi:hypothetical protein